MYSKSKRYQTFILTAKWRKNRPFISVSYVIIKMEFSDY